MPFSDPFTDGPSIQRAMERALEAGATLAGALDAVISFGIRSADGARRFSRSAEDDVVVG